MSKDSTRDDKSNRFAKYYFLVSATVIGLGASYLYGALSYRLDLFPTPLVRSVFRETRNLIAPGYNILEMRSRHATPIDTPHPDRLAPGLLLIVAAVADERDASVRVIDRDGNTIHEWMPRWQEVWGDRDEVFPEERRPRGSNGMNIHGIEMLPDASFVANFEHLSTFRMDICGKVSWALDNLGHHSVSYSPQGHVWVGAERYIAEGDTGYPNHSAPLNSYKIEKISLDGEILEQIEIIDVLRQNGLDGLLYLSNLHNVQTTVEGDTLHANDVEEFPQGWQSATFVPGDLMVSLRNINAVMVFDPDTLKIKFLSIGQLLRQHDPDFLPGDRISVFDNRNLSPSQGSSPAASRIVELNTRDGTSKVVLEGEGDGRFFTAIMGVHQRLANGNILVTASGEGRVIEFAADGTMVWRFSNRIADETNGRVYTAIALPEHMDAEFFRKRHATCQD
ncbi:MAG: arylsulfotransferase family protein [Pseudomonadota bacterium]